MKETKKSGIFGRLQRTPHWKAEEFTELQYQPTSVKDLLTEMKDISELIIDLAYSAVMFSNNDIAEEVKFLEVRMDKLNYDIRMTAMLAARDKEDAEKLSGILQVAEAAETISNAAGDIAKLLSLKEKTSPMLPKLLSKAEEQLFRITVSEKSKACTQTLGAMKVETETGMRIIAIRRENCWIYNPQADTTLQAKDIIIVRGINEGYKELDKFLKGESEVLE